MDDLVRKLTVLITANTDDFQKAMAGMNGSLKETEAASTSLGSKLSSIGSNVYSLGKSLLPMSIGAAAALGLAAKQAVSFDQAMELLHTQAGLSQQQVDGLKNSVLALAPAVGVGPTELATAFYHIASAGAGIWSTAQMLDILKISAEGAAVGQANLDDTTYALSSTIASGITGFKDAAEAMATLNAIVGSGDMRFQDLNAAMSTGIESTAATFGVSLPSLGAALATLTDNGERADEAATRLRMTLALLAAPTAKAATLLGDIGLSGPAVTASTSAMTNALQAAGLTTTKMADDLRQPNGIMVALQDLKSHLESAGLSADSADALLSRAFGGGRTDAALMTMLQNLDRMDSKYKQIGKTTGQFANDWAAQQNQAKQKLADFTAEVDVAGVKLGNAFLPTLISVARAIASIADWFGKLSPAWQKIIAFILLSVTVLGPLLMALGAMASGLGVLIGLFGALTLAGGLWIAAAVAIAAVGLYVITHWQQVKDFFSRLMNDIKTDFNGLPGPIRDAAMLAVTLFLGPLLSIVRNVRNIVDLVKAMFSELVPHLGDVGRAATEALLAPIFGIPGTMASILSHLPGAGVLKSLGHDLHIPGFASGTNFAPGGLAMVGEQGPELVNLPRGSQVLSASRTSAMGSGGSTVNLNVSVGNYLGEPGELRNFAKQLYLEMMRVANANGVTLPNIGLNPQ